MINGSELLKNGEEKGRLKKKIVPLAMYLNQKEREALREIYNGRDRLHSAPSGLLVLIIP